MRLKSFYTISAFALLASAQTTDSGSSAASASASAAAGTGTVVTISGTNTPTDVTSQGADYATGSDLTYASNSVPITIPTTRTYATLTAAASESTLAANSSMTGNSTTSSTSPTQTLLVGGGGQTSTATNGTSSGNSTATSSSVQPTNTQPCNGYPEFCQRKYSNITHVAAHNSPFTQQGNAARNQMLDVETQLNDGIRMLQFQTHKVNDTLYMCHTSCDLLNAGPLVDYLTTVREWLDNNPYDVVTILMGNSDVLAPGNYTAPVTNSGLLKYVYTAPTVPMPLASWPTLAEMILTNTRVVIMLDYEANQQEIPWLLDEFSQMWETPFSPTDRDFPCTPQRPPDRPDDIRRDRMYMANHNLNVEIAVAGISLDVPAFPIMNETNGVGGYGSAGATIGNCTQQWNRPPTFLLVDFYNLGSFNGSALAVAAAANGVQYNRDSCCGTEQRESAAIGLRSTQSFTLAAAVSIAIFMLM